MSDDVIEYVAKAIYATSVPDRPEYYWDLTAPTIRQSCRVGARAAIDALRGLPGNLLPSEAKLHLLATACIGGEAFPDLSDVMSAAACDGNGYWADLHTPEARSIGRLILAALGEDQ